MLMDSGTIEWLTSLQAASEAGEKLCNSSDEYDAACRHIVQLLHDSSMLLEAESHATAAFLAITAIEEVVKVNFSLYRRSSTPLKRSKDPLFKHGEKHKLAMAPVLPIGTRLCDAIGKERLIELMRSGGTGGFVTSREASLYLERVSNTLVVPRDAISLTYARELLLLAIEVFDDALVGGTNESFRLGEITDELFRKWTHAEG